ncbi:hypothetical protein NXT3_CH01106 [Sinorhizobium fredii]|uniref:Uncharacterized protein n=1 Tax=Rhizobium fredii TaxID=380 RepID=A0A2L0H2M1_RHIFR|nr:hypothetical protein NXT3_CH01106 [Sinorhizobium fredii]
MFDRNARSGSAKRHPISHSRCSDPDEIASHNLCRGDEPACKTCCNAMGRDCALRTSATLHCDRAGIHAAEMIRDIISKAACKEIVHAVCRQLRRRYFAEADPHIYAVTATRRSGASAQPSLL